MKLSIIIPVYNEKNTILRVIDEVRKVPLEKEIIVVDDGSTDGTRELLAQFRIPDSGYRQKYCQELQLCEMMPAPKTMSFR